MSKENDMTNETTTNQPIPAKLAAALIKAQAKIEGAAKDANNPHFRSKYADLESVIDAIKGPLNECGIGFVQLPLPAEGSYLALETVLFHESGESIRATMKMPLGKNDPQGYGSAMTYARRYSLGAITGLKFLDDDGEGAMGRQQQPKPQAPAPKPQPQQPKPHNGNGVKLATTEQVEELKRLVKAAGIPQETLDAWKKAAEVTAFSDMPAEQIAKCIDYAKRKMESKAAA